MVPPAIIALLSGGMGVREAWVSVDAYSENSKLDPSLAQEAWTFSELLEPLALIPQYIVCYRVAGLLTGIEEVIH